MKVTFLGTGTSMGVPVVMCPCAVCTSTDSRDKRLRTSVYIEEGDTGIVIDTGPDFRQQMLANGVKNLSAIVFTHEHKDHTGGLDDIRPFNYQKKGAIPVYATLRVIDHIKKEYEYIFAETRYPGIPEVEMNEITDVPFYVNDILLEPIKVLHHKLPVLGFKIGKFAYITDANHISESEKQKLRNLDVLILNALQIDPHISHFTLQQALNLVEELKPRATYFTHISHKLGRHADIQAILPPSVWLAYDGLTLDSDAK